MADIEATEDMADIEADLAALEEKRDSDSNSASDSDRDSDSDRGYSSDSDSDKGEEASDVKDVSETKDKVEKRDSNASNILSSRLTVQARVAQGVVFYDVFNGQHGMSVSTRYSELSRFHEDVMKEVPEFRGQLPRKTFLRHTNTDFVESRRVDLQGYLRAVATDSRVSESKVFQNFFQAQKQLDLSLEDGSPAETMKKAV
jgi:hypothetical protein